MYLHDIIVFFQDGELHLDQIDQIAHIWTLGRETGVKLILNKFFCLRRELPYIGLLIRSSYHAVFEQ